MPPLIVIGMHRSGTSLFSKVLEAAGVFMGHDIDALHESRFHRRVNNWLLSQLDANWFDVRAIDEALRDERIHSLGDDLGWALAQPEIVDYLGPGVNDPSRLALDRPWGWKDPRTTLTLSLWLSQYPDARVVHVYRHGVDVARSLWVRDQKRIKRELESEQDRSHFLNQGKERMNRDGQEALEMDAALELWAQYMNYGVAGTGIVGDQAVTIRYEDFLQDPRAELRTLEKIYPLQLDTPSVDAILSGINERRAFSYRSDAELVSFADRHQQRLAMHGY